MKIEIFTKNRFAVIGKMGSTESGEGFIAALWKDANLHFHEVEPLARRDENGSLVGCWGAMSDRGMRFLPWEKDFREGLYLAGIESRDDAEAPAGWVKWIIPGFRYLRIEVQEGNRDTFTKGLSYLAENRYPLVGAVQELTDPKTGVSYLCFPIERL